MGEVGGYSYAPAGLPLETAQVPIGVGPTAGLDGCGKSCPPPGFDPRTVQ